MSVLTDEVIASFKDAARKLTGPKRRAFQAQVTLDYLDGSIWKAERVFGWSHHTVALGLNELRTGITCQGNFSARGNHKTETKNFLTVTDFGGLDVGIPQAMRRSIDFAANSHGTGAG